MEMIRDVNFDEKPVAVTQYESGVALFSRLFTRLMDSNGFSHPTTVLLAKAALGGAGWLHSSSINGLRKGSLMNPGPRTFVAVQALNEALWRYESKKILIPGTTSSNLYQDARAITEDGVAPDLGWWFEIFAGIRQPKDPSLLGPAISSRKAEEYSAAWGALMRALFMRAGIDLIVEHSRLISQSYPSGDTERVRKCQQVLFGHAVWSAEEFLNELPALTSFSKALGGPASEEDLLEELSHTS